MVLEHIPSSLFHRHSTPCWQHTQLSLFTPGAPCAISSAPMIITHCINPLVGKLPAAEVAGIITGGVTVVVFAAVIGVLCWRFPACRSRSFWDKNIKRALRKVYGKCKKKKVKEEKKSLIIGPMLRKRSRDEAPFVVPQIFVDYGSRRTSYASASDHMMLGALALDLRRSSGSSAGSRRTSLASDSDSHNCPRQIDLSGKTIHGDIFTEMGLLPQIFWRFPKPLVCPRLTLLNLAAVIGRRSVPSSPLSNTSPKLSLKLLCGDSRRG
ncbi:hypothetical protein RRG08_047702 [Elysia crispata]|uniref:Uncharacterized protein n=1 Tax=Elysia crispata TaxID=231223 RepID=A0AAE1E6E5_9GAST|nr:hypothetical protein RRG08_047702 [Elysia crispata]